jgi:outer membrane protein assembly factor BamB
MKSLAKNRDVTASKAVYLCLLASAALALLSGCGGRVTQEIYAKSTESAFRSAETIRVPPAVPMWLGNPARSFYGTGPWPTQPLEVVWEFETEMIAGRLHKDKWGGSSWPGQPSVVGDRVYFGSADSYVYCLNARDGSLIWSYKTLDSLKATPTIVGDRLIASGLDHNVYCLNAHDGTLIWVYKTGFEVDSSAAVIDGRVFFGGEDHFFYCLNLEDGSLVYKREVGSVEGSFTVSDNRIFVGTEQGDLYCLNLEDGATLWKTHIGADSNSTPAVANGLVYTAAEDGYVSCYRQSTGEPVWKFKASDGTKHTIDGKLKDAGGFWASPVISDGRVFIGSENKSMYCLTAGDGKVVWRKQARGAIWGTSPVVDGRVVFGDKAGWMYMLSAEDGRLIWELRIGENINATPAILDGRIYIGAFNGNLYCLGARPNLKE